MWAMGLSLLTSKTTWIVVVAAIITIFVGALLYKNQSLKSTIAEKETEIVSLQAQLDNAKQAIAGYKGTLEGKDTEIKSTQAQIIAGNIAIKSYKERMDKANEILLKAKCVPADEKTGVLDAQSTDEVIDALNCLAGNSCERMLPKTKDSN